jgi:hypothetical protein
MFVKFSFTVVRCDQPQPDLGSFLTTACCIIFPMHTVPGQTQADDRGICSGYDDNEEAPIGSSVTGDYPVDKRVTHQ